MKTSTIMWIVAVLIILVGIGFYWYSATPVAAPTTDVNSMPNPSGTNLPAGDMTPTPPSPIGSSTDTSTVSASSTTTVH